MALRSSINFEVFVVGDGSSKVVTMAFATGPFVLNVGTAGQLPAGFDLASLLPVAVDILAVGSGITVTASLGTLNQTVTFTYASALGVDVQDTITGTLRF